MGQVCQSCGMPMNKDPGGGGTEADGTHSSTYCSLCYDSGVFRQPDFDVTQDAGVLHRCASEKGNATVHGLGFHPILAASGAVENLTRKYEERSGAGQIPPMPPQAVVVPWEVG